eukprot:CAMPEP_0184300948 /NCGR_PEP_ID=MMETSP1049-20130417/11251_1 /TAXON_ID=77928 /ORGANISM="Proteomonas sulcata, Strain CCMP704" /LENGTH=438 /DNA_ID=CAMNT_0026611803 /DNA_START=35 /DNA_END=1351 /DNA_ORIENTATION=+
MAWTAMSYVRVCVAVTGFIFMAVGVSLQFGSADHLYGVPMEHLCQAYSGSKELSDVASFKALLETVADQRSKCLALAIDPATGQRTDERWQQTAECCMDHSPERRRREWWITGICAKPWITDPDLIGVADPDTGPLSPSDAMDLYSSILGDFIGVSEPGAYLDANAEFWCKNCPNDYRQNCPFDMVDTDSGEDGVQTGELCDCPGGSLTPPGEAFWAMDSDHTISADYVKCGDKADVYEAWLQALFPEWSTEQHSKAKSRFLTRCWENKSFLGYILSVGPTLSTIAGLICLASLIPYCANSPCPTIGFNFAMLGIALTLVGFWPLSFAGASRMLSRYNFCYGLSDPLVLNMTSDSRQYHSAPVFFNGNPCYDVNSLGEHKWNPFVEEIGVFNSGYVTGGVLSIIGLVFLLSAVSKSSDIVLEQKVQTKENGRDANEGL